MVQDQLITKLSSGSLGLSDFLKTDEYAERFCFFKQSLPLSQRSLKAKDQLWTAID